MASGGPIDNAGGVAAATALEFLAGAADAGGAAGYFGGYGVACDAGLGRFCRGGLRGRGLGFGEAIFPEAAQFGSGAQQDAVGLDAGAVDGFLLFLRIG